MRHLVSSEVTKTKIAKWMDQAVPLDKTPTWTERRLAIEFGGHVYLVVNDQVFQCAHCGHYDPQWSVTSILSFFEEVFGIKPIEIEITCSVAKESE